MESWQWLFVFFAVLMVARIVPRLIRQRKMSMQRGESPANDQPFLEGSLPNPFEKEQQKQSFEKEKKPESKEMMVLGQIVRDYKTYGQIRKNTGLDSEELDSILGDLENRGLMRVERKKGLLGEKVELLPTEKGYREYDS